jgi:MscS family membrane protein
MGGLSILEREFLGNPLWQYGLLFIVLFVGIFISRFVEYIFTHRLLGLAKRTPTKLDETIIHITKKPLRLVIFLLALHIGLSLFSFPENIRKILTNIFNILVALIVAYFLVRMVDLLIAYIQPRVEATESKLDDQMLPILRKSLRVFIVVIVFLVVLQNMGYNIFSLLAGLGLGGLALALAAQETLSNFFGSIAIFADRPFHVGDRIQVEGYDGPVEAIGFRSTKIRTLDGTLVTIPNSKIANTCINNISARPTIKRLYTIGITYNSGYEKMCRALEIIREVHKEVEEIENYWVYFRDFGSHSLDILVISWCKELKYEEYLKIQERINLEIMRRFDEEGIEFAFPTHTIYLKGENNEKGRMVREEHIPS